MPTTAQFLTELVEQVQRASSRFEDRVYSIYNLEELSSRAMESGFPMVAVAYEGLEVPSVNQGQGARPTVSSADAYLVTRMFSVIVAVEYNWNNEIDDEKAVATDLLDALRTRLLGFKGVNNRPYKLVSEGPTNDEHDGVIFYAQIWSADSIETGSSI
jgi:hypothetical protein